MLFGNIVMFFEKHCDVLKTDYLFFRNYTEPTN